MGMEEDKMITKRTNTLTKVNMGHSQSGEERVISGACDVSPSDFTWHGTTFTHYLGFGTLPLAALKEGICWEFGVFWTTR